MPALRDRRRSGAAPGRRRSSAAPALALAALLTVTGVLHFATPAGFESIVPRFLGSPAFWVAVSGVAELACAVLLALPRTRRLGGWACVALFVAVYPANITMAVHALQGHGSVAISLLRLPLQVPLVLWALHIARGRVGRAVRPRAEDAAAAR